MRLKPSTTLIPPGLIDLAGILKSRVGIGAAACGCVDDDDGSPCSFFPNRPAASDVPCLFWASELLLQCGNKFLPVWNDAQSFTISKHISSEFITRRASDGIGLEVIMLKETVLISCEGK
mmetsp:Transcript_24811/g.42226  ORF Transcript_24811/g.42226 Transcript_24811/m.42226 type:complete len:120 (+) Transcript_24811:214-573(+)